MASLRRLPWTSEGKESFVSAGDGFVNRLADAAENHPLDAVAEAVPESLALADDQEATADELRSALRALACLTQDVATVATLRGDRLGIRRGDEEGQS